MGYGSASHSGLTKDKKVAKFNRKIVKHRRNTDHSHQQINKHRPYHNGFKQKRSHYRKRSSSRQYALNFSPQYQPASPIISVRPLSYSDQYKPQILGFQQQTNNETYMGYIDSLMLLKMQQQERRNQELIEKLGNITFEDNSVIKEQLV